MSYINIKNIAFHPSQQNLIIISYSSLNESRGDRIYMTVRTKSRQDKQQVIYPIHVNSTPCFIHYFSTPLVSIVITFRALAKQFVIIMQIFIILSVLPEFERDDCWIFVFH